MRFTSRLVCTVLASALALVVGAALVLSSSAPADEVVLTNGDKLTGEVLDASGGKLRIKVDYSGQPVVVDMAKVKSITVDKKPIEVRLKSGEVLKGKIEAGAEGKLSVVGEGRGPAEVPWTQVDALNPAKVAWHGTLTAAGTSQGGNIERQGMASSFEAQRRSEQDKFTVRALYNYAEEESVMTTRNVFVAAQYNYYFYKHLYGYVSEELYSDKFRDLNLQSVSGGGLGLQVVEGPRFSLAFEAGAAYSNNDYREGEDDNAVVLRGAGLLKVSIFNRLIFTDNLVYLPSIDSASYQVRNEAALTTPLGAGWSLKVAHIFEYNNDPPEGVELTDRTLMVGLQYSF